MLRLAYYNKKEEPLKVYDKPIVAYRVWYYYDNKLYSIIMNKMAWEPGKVFYASNHHMLIHAFKDKNDSYVYGQNALETIWHYTFRENNDKIIHTPHIYGEVYLWGRIKEHQNGYQAECAYPKKLKIPKSHPNAKEIALNLRNIYGCEVEFIVGDHVYVNAFKCSREICHNIAYYPCFGCQKDYCHNDMKYSFTLGIFHFYKNFKLKKAMCWSCYHKLPTYRIVKFIKKFLFQVGFSEEFVFNYILDIY